METNSLKYILEHPNDNGIIVFILGILFVLSVYHFLLFFQNKDKVYLYYSLYTFLIFISHLTDATTGFIPILIKPFVGLLDYFDIPLMWLYNTVYFIFGFTFVRLKSYSEGWYSFIFKTAYLLLVVIFIVTTLSITVWDINFILKVNLWLVGFLFVFGIACFYPLFKLKMPLKYYIISGAMVLYISSFIAFYLDVLDIIPDENQVGYSIFYIGIVIENILFSLGLGQKQKLLLQEKNASQNSLILQLKENEHLRNTIQKQLEKDVASMSEQAEKEKYDKLKAEYDKELVELKISSLRSQMNPHFIFNSLNAIKLYIIDNEKENAVYYLNKFSKLIRKILATTREKEITLADEIETLKLYIDIENIRFSNEIQSSISIDKTLGINTIKIPSLILQPFIENAIWHGLSSKKGVKKIDITFEKEANTHLKITIADNGIGRKRSNEINSQKIHKKDSIGIKLTEERLNNFCKDFENNYSLSFVDLFDRNNNSTGTKLILSIPLF